MPRGPAARILDPVVHPLPGMLMPGPGSINTIIGGKLAWRGVPAAAAAALSSAKAISDAAIKTAEAATVAAAGTPGAPVAKAAEEATKAAAATAMGSMITGMAGGADIHACTTPLPLPPHGPGVVIDGSPTVLINGLPACRQGDTILEAVGPPDKIMLGCFTVIIGDAPGASPSGPEIFGTAIQFGPTDTDEFKLKVMRDLAAIQQTPSGAAMLRDLYASGRTVTITETAGGNASTTPAGSNRLPDGTRGAGADSTVRYNPDRQVTGPEPWQTRPPAIGLAHELIHATHKAYGDRDPNSVRVQNDSKPDPSDPTNFATERQEEVRTAGIDGQTTPPYQPNSVPYSENTIRDEWDPKQPERQWY